MALLPQPAGADGWTGFSFGVGGGYGIANHELTLSPGPALDPDDFNVNINGLAGDGGFFTVSAGYDRKIAPSIVVGAFIDYDFADIDTKLTLDIPPFDLAARADLEVENQLSIGGRIGALVTPDTLFFITAGYAHIETSDLAGSATLGPDTISGAIAGIGSFNGYFLGFGAETKVADGFTVKTEYRYTDLESQDVVLLPDAALGIEDFVKTSIQPTIQSIRLSLNYRYGSGGGDAVDDSAAASVISTNWTGWYLGLGSGYAAASNEVGIADATGGGDFALNIDGLAHEGGFIALSGGYDYQSAPKIVIGAFVDYDFLNLKHQDSLSIGPSGLGLAFQLDGEIKDLLMIGGRIGYLATAGTLLFASAGFANGEYGNVRVGGSFGGGPSESITLVDDERFSGFFLGAGIESRLNAFFSLKAEYRYADLGSERVTLLPDEFPEINDIVSTTFDPIVQTGRISINYRFNGQVVGANAAQ